MNAIVPAPQTRIVDTIETYSTAKAELLRRYRHVRGFSKKICETLEPEDYVIQTMPEASPTKWHLAHTSWFFETFVLKQFFPDYHSLHPQYAFLFNSYYNAVGPFYSRPHRGLLSRPTVKEVFRYRTDMDLLVSELIESADEQLLAKLEPILTLGLHHEQQHQELMLTDIKSVFWQNPLRPGISHTRSEEAFSRCPRSNGCNSRKAFTGWDMRARDSAMTMKGPAIVSFVQSFELASRLVTNAEFLAFMEDGGYRRPELWLSLGWNTVKERGWDCPALLGKAGWKVVHHDTGGNDRIGPRRTSLPCESI